MDRKDDEKVNRADLLATGVICALLGAVTSWLLFVWLGDKAKGFEVGALADWVGAAATGLIGFGANRYAKIANLQRLDELDERRRIEVVARNAHLTAAAMALVHPAGIAVAIDSFLERPREERNILHFGIAMDGLKSRLGSVNLDPEILAVLPIQAVTTLGHINIRLVALAAMHGLAQSYLDDYEAKGKPLDQLADDADCQLVEEMRGPAYEIRDFSSKFSGMIRAARGSRSEIQMSRTEEKPPADASRNP